MLKGLVSIITPVFNSEKYVKETIYTVLNQTYENWELILVDDNSTDKSREIIQNFIKNNKKIRYYKLKKNSGPAVARNFGTKKATGEFIAFLDSDDLWEKNKLEKQISFMKKNNYSITCTSYAKIDELGIMLNKTIDALSRADYNRVLLDNPVGNSSIIYNVSKIGKCYIPNIRKRNDLALWLNILRTKTDFIYGMPEVLMKYRVRENSVSSNKFDLIKYHWVLYREYENLSVSKSIFCIGYLCTVKALHIKHKPLIRSYA